MQLSHPLRHTRRAIDDLRGSHSGVSMIEFAIALPVLLLLGLGGLETVHFVQANLVVTQMTMTVADNAGRVRTSIDETDINQLMVGAKKVGEPIDFAANGRIILSDLEQRTNVTGGATTITTDNPNGFRQWIRWQRCAGAMRVAPCYGGPIDANGAAVTDLDSTVNVDHGAVETKSLITGMGPGSNLISASSGTAVMVAELIYVYQPITPIPLYNGRIIRRLQAFNVRQRNNFIVRNDASLLGNRRSDCRLNAETVPTL